MVEPESGTSSRDYLPKVPKGWLEELEDIYKDVSYIAYPNMYTMITDKLCSEVYSQSKYWERNLSHADFLHQLTKEQRTLFSLVNFEAQTNNGGVYQFLFNQPELSLIALDAMRTVSMDSLAHDYEMVLRELLGSTEAISTIRNKFQDHTQEWTDRWNAFAEGYDEIESTEVIEAYFYDPDFIQQFRLSLVEYVKANRLNLFIEHV